ncbi:MAG: VWA domain-containing protein [Candidatus Riflebacteria bacterium]|nr:VWA domain-containing protein [Candidatus Riflebacteria bacterium]
MTATFEFARPDLLLLAAAVILPTVLWHHLSADRRRRGTVRFSEVGRLKASLSGASFYLRHLLAILRLAALALAILALGRPRLSQSIEELLTRGIDIVLCMDLSGSMLAEDMEPDNRVTAAKKVAEEFIRGRRSDRIGLVVFAGRAYTMCPLTTDYSVLLSLLEKADPSLMREDGTAIGMGLSTALNRLRETGAPSRIVVLVTDGRNNKGKIEPATAAEMAKALGIKVYAVGVGGHGRARVPVLDPKTGKAMVDPFSGQRMYGYTDEDLNEEMLRDVASSTGGVYFRATATSALQAVFSEIDRMEKSDVKTREYHRYTELFIFFLTPALLLLILEAVLASTRLRRIP